jgi:hypothetical protein
MPCRAAAGDARETTLREIVQETKNSPIGQSAGKSTEIRQVS